MEQPTNEAATAPAPAGGEGGGTATATPEAPKTAIPQRRAENSAAERAKSLGRRLASGGEESASEDAGGEPTSTEQSGDTGEERVSRRQARQQKTESTEETASGDEPVVDERGRKHDPKSGKYMPDEDEVAAEGADEESVEAADEKEVATEATGEEETDARATDSSGDEGADAEAAERPSGGDEATEPISVELPEHDTLRQTGRAAIDVVSQADADIVKGILNREGRLRTELVNREKQLDEREQELVQLRSTQTASEEWKQSSEYQAHAERFRKLKRLEQQGEVPEGTSSQYWKGAQSDFQALRDEKYSEQMGEVQDRKAQEAGERWVRDAYSRTQSMTEEVRNLPEFQRWFKGSVSVFDRMVEAGEFGDRPSPTELHEQFQKFFGARLMLESSVREAYRRSQQQSQQQRQKRETDTRAQKERERKMREEAKKQGAEELKKQMAEKREKAPPNPMGRMEHASTPQAATGEEEENEPLPQNRVQARRRGESRAAERARERMAGR